MKSRLAEFVGLDCLGANQTEFQVALGSTKATKHLPFEHMFDPEGSAPESPF